MQLIVYAIILSIFSVGTFYRYEFVPRYITWMPELLSLVTLIVVVLHWLRNKQVNIGLPYLVLFMLLVIHIICGVVVNEVSSGPLFTAMRVYFKYIPLFFLPLVYEFSETQLKGQLRLLIYLTALQLPIAIYQRFFESVGLDTGDFVRGTIGTSGILSIYLISAFGLLLGFYLRKWISKPVFIIGAAIFLLPTTLNETKATVILLPIAIVLPVLISAQKGRLKNLLGLGALGIGFLAAFSLTYEHFYPTRHSVVEFYTSAENLQKNLAPGASGYSANRQGRLDVLLAPFNEFGNDPVKLMFGLGVGNNQESFLGEKFSGKYYKKFGSMMYLAFANMVWEIGLLGTLLMLAFWVKVFGDTLYVSRIKGFNGAIALGWISVMGVLFLSLFYKNIITNNVVGYLFWFYSGYIVGVRFKMAAGQNQESVPSVSAAARLG